MKVKELQKTVNVAWSPLQQNPIMLAAGTAAQQLDTSFGNTSTLEIYSVNLSDPGYDMELKASLASPYKFHKLVWTPLGFGGAHPSGVLVGGCEGGHLQVYSAAKLLAGEEALLAHQDKHSGAVRTLDFNPFQTNLLASASSESEILIWDLNNTASPMTPGTKTQPPEDVQCVAWNRQVQHIMASVFSSRCIVWDLRKNEPIIKLSDSQSRVRWRQMQWHPEIATQLWLASEEDQAPVVQLWDLRYATAPTKSLQIHQRGVLGLTWCPRDSDLMVSCGKDNKILCWNPNATQAEGEILSELASTLQWYSDVQWCPRNPAIVAAASLDGNVTVYSLFGGSQQQVHTTSKIADSFPGMEAMTAQMPTPQPATMTTYSDLKRPPKWLRRPAGASFGFGGKLVTFQSSNPRQVVIKQVITEPELVERSNRLEAVLQQGDFGEYCRQKADQTSDQFSRYLWYFLRANFDANPQSEMLNLLGYHQEDVSAKFLKILQSKQDPVEQVTDQMAELSRGVDGNAMFDAIVAGQKMIAENGLKSPPGGFVIKTGEDTEGLICQALLTGNLEAAVELCMESGRTTEGIIVAMTGGSELLASTQYRYLRRRDTSLSHIISALITQEWTGVVNQCAVESWKEALVAILTHNRHHTAPLCAALGERLLQEARTAGNSDTAQNAILCYLCAGSVEHLVEAWQEQKVSGDIQDLVEVVMLLQKAMETQGRAVEVKGKLATLLSRYAKMLVGQGALDSALSYLGATTDEDLADLKDRLYFALGYKQLPRPAATQRTSSNTQFQTMRMTPSRASLPSQPAPPQPASLFTPAVPQMPTVPAVAQQFPFQPPAPAPVEALAQPPRPASGGGPQSAVSSGGGLLSRSKYLLDPSVQSGMPSYGQSYATPQTTSPPGAQFGQFNQPQPMQQPFQQSQFPSFVPTPAQQPQMFTPEAPPAPQVAPPPMAMAKPATSAPGWNDPPALKSNRPPQAPPPATSAYNPIMHPLFPADQSAAAQPPNGYQQPDGSFLGQSAGMVPQMAQQSFNYGAGGQFAPPQQQFTGQMGFQQVPAPTPGLQPAATPPQKAPTPEPPKPKAPIPEEHIYMQTVLNELRNQCVNAAANPQVKRKLEDVARRLESLYDLLREYRLGANTLAALNQLVQFVQIGDYASGLALHTQMCSGADFAQIAVFMPGIKVLLQTAMQLQVYLR
ncbi:protein transport protein Sec31A isoform X2 [Phlebotomus argentipes]|uniref:protein transport protein Sec31A isoform X2 n=1 Tax=Phlebotomus argentipes TaxID=94469 RepID=UPI0028929CE3|nr:protein transport protein Sec31A isoform X2 [Phlebotomus argentipes]